MLRNKCSRSKVRRFDPKRLLRKMKIFILILLGFSILLIGGDIDAIYGSFLRRLLLPGHKIISFLPFIGIVYYSPFWILNNYSHKIKIEKFYSRGIVTKFEKQFNTHVFQYGGSGGTYFVVPKRDYDKSMDAFLLNKRKEESN